MRALVWYGERALELEELPQPTPGDDEVLLDVELAGICGSDLHPYRGHAGPRVPPLVLGHEAVVRAEGRAYALYPLIGCGTCGRCRAGEDNLCASWRLIGMHRAGVFADAVTAPRRSLVPLPAGLDAERAVLAEPLACCVGALRPHDVAPGTTVLVLGCGPIGLLTVFLAARAGADVVATDPLAARRVQAERLGARTAPDVPSGSVDVAVDAAGFETTWRAAVDAVRAGGTAVMVGLGQAEGVFPMAAVVRRGVTVRGQFAYSRADFAAALDVLAAQDFDRSWIAEAPLAEGPRAFADLVDRPAEVSKVLLRP